MRRKLIVLLMLVCIACISCFVLTGCGGLTGDNSNGTSTEQSGGDNKNDNQHNGGESFSIPAGDYSVGLEYELLDDVNAYSVIWLGTCEDFDIKIPPTCNGLPVVEIADGAFEECYWIKSVIIPDSVVSIVDCAFAQTGLTSIIIPKSVTEIGSGTFYGCYNLTNIQVAEDNPNYKSIDGNLYSKDGKTFIAYAPGKMTTSFDIPEGVEVIADDAFEGCGVLINITIPNTIKSIGGDAFSECYRLKYTEQDGLYYLGNSTNKYLYLTDCAWEATSVNINPNCKFIGDYALSGCDSLTSVVIPDSVTSIGDSAFWSCDSLTSVTIGNSVTSIGDSAFYYCSSLTSVVFKDTTTWYRRCVDDGVYDYLEEIDVTNPTANANICQNSSNGLYKK